VSAVGLRVSAAPAAGGERDGGLLGIAYAAAVEDLLGRVGRACAAAGTRSERIEAGVGALLERLAARPELARSVLIDAPSAGGSIRRARAEAHRRFAELMSGLGEGASAPPATVEAGVRTIENVLAAHLLGGESGSLAELGPVVVRVVSSRCVGWGVAGVSAGAAPASLA
jgi:hypothetical protein